MTAALDKVIPALMAGCLLVLFGLWVVHGVMR